jgi:cysteine sulfinate desulfinase/cysteine desulfurase-like protein
VLRSIGLSHEDAQSTLRIGLGRFNTVADVEIASKEIYTAIERLT